MNTNEAIKEYERRLAVMRAHAEGKEIQIRCEDFQYGEWIPWGDPEWNWEQCDYRIKPEPVTLYLNIWKADAGTWSASVRNNKDDALRATIARGGASNFAVVALPVTLPEPPE